MPNDQPDNDSKALAEALAAAEIALPIEQFALLDGYRRLLWQWNERLNLTRHTTAEKFVTRDVIDSLEFAKQLGKDETVLDIGSGGGVPGIVLAILRPDLVVSVCDSVVKKGRVLEEITA
ncbi:MAG: 16S rRNA (guanine(527)-N(7))-methyltransferase RsmG, partial [Lacipirellulaceae bacterium]